MAPLLQSAQSWIAGIFRRSHPKGSLWKTVGYNLSDPGTASILGSSGGISPHDAVTISAVHCCVSLISNTIAGLPLFLYRSSGEGRARATDHPLFDLLHAFPNGEMGAVDFRSTLLNDALLYGNGFAEIERYANGSVRALWWLPAQYVTAQRDSDGAIWYTFAAGTEDQTHLPARNCLHIRTGPLDENGIMAVSVLTRAASSLGLNLSAEGVAQAMMDQGIKSAGVLQHPGRLSAEAVDRLRSDFTRVHSGTENAGKVIVLENGMTFNPVQTTATDNQFLEQRQYAVREVARWFHVPLSKLKAIDSPGFKTIDSEQQQFLTDCLQPILIRIEQEVMLKCLSTVERRTHKVEHDLNGLLRANIERRVQAMAVARNWGWLSANDCRKLEGLDPIGPEGDQYLQPLNMQPLGKGVGARAPAGESPVIDSSFSDVDVSETDTESGLQPAMLDMSAQTPDVQPQPQQDVQAAALNGAQVTALVDLALKVAGGLLPKSAAIAIAKAAFPLVGDATIAAIFGNIKELSPEEMAAGAAASSGKAPPAPVATNSGTSTPPAGSGVGG